MRFLHTMLRVRNLDAALNFYCNLLGLEEVRRRTDEKNKYTLVFLAAPEDAPAAKAAREATKKETKAAAKATKAEAKAKANDEQTAADEAQPR